MTTLNLDEMPQYAFISEEEYFSLEEKAVIRHEYYEGEIFAMAGGSHEHAVLMANTSGAVVPRLRGQKCYTASSEQRIKVEATGLITYPDLAIVCPPLRFAGKNTHTLLNPRAIFEILSPSTSQYDKTIKFANVKEIDEMTDYILIEQDSVGIEHRYRDDDGLWQSRIHDSLDDMLRLAGLDLEIPLSEIYERLTFLPEII